MLIDAHAHFDDAGFDEDRAAALQRAHEVGVEAQIIPGVKADWWPRIRRLCREHQELHAGYGLHPAFSILVGLGAMVAVVLMVGRRAGDAEKQGT